MNLLTQEPNPSPDYCTIPLSKGLVAIVDADDYEWLMQWTWYAHQPRVGSHIYAARKTSRKLGKSRIIYMHRQVLGLEFGDQRWADHREPNNTLDNRRSNLRYATPSQNGANSRKRKNNTSGLKGVSQTLVGRKWNGRWRADITVNRERILIGNKFSTPEDAHAAYCRILQEKFGAFARFQ